MNFFNLTNLLEFLKLQVNFNKEVLACVSNEKLEKTVKEQERLVEKIFTK